MYTRAHEALADLWPRLSSLSSAKKMQMHAPNFWNVTRNARGRTRGVVFFLNLCTGAPSLRRDVI